MKPNTNTETAETVQTGGDHAVIRPLPAGTQIEYCDIRASIIRDDGGSCVDVEIPGEGRMSWHWKFQGEECKIIQENAERTHPHQ